MIRFAANLSMLFTETEFLSRFSRAATAGFRGVEYLFPYEFEISELRGELVANRLKQVLFNMPPGDWQAGDRGLAAQPGREREFDDALVLALEYARALECPQVHVMAGSRLGNCGEDEQRAVYVRNIRRVADAFQPYGIKALIEPINFHDMPGYFLNTPQQAASLLTEIGRDNVAMQFDLYHCQIMTGHLMASLEKHWPLISHIQIASVPGRHEPDQGEINYAWILRRLDEMGYAGWVGCEYRPRGDTEAGLKWLHEMAL
jgi:2-dehydrotetronate isomerase